MTRLHPIALLIIAAAVLLFIVEAARAVAFARIAVEGFGVWDRSVIDPPLSLGDWIASATQATGWLLRGLSHAVRPALDALQAVGWAFTLEFAFRTWRALRKHPNALRRLRRRAPLLRDIAAPPL